VRATLAGAVLTVALTLAACAGAPVPIAREDDPGPMHDILASHPGTAAILARAPRFRLQAVYGVIEPDGQGRARLVQHGFRLGAEYFYPASAVKLLAAAAALERLEALRRETGLPLDADTSLVIHPLFEGEALIDADPSNLEGGAVTLRHEIRKLFLVSDNESFNRLYEFLGQDGLAAALARAGLPRARLVHRLAQPRSAEENRRAPRFDFLGAAGTSPLYTLPERLAPALPDAPPIAGLLVGRGYMTNDEPPRLVENPMDFSPKNQVPLADLQRGLCMVVAPDADCGGAGFTLAPADRELLLESMRSYAGDSTNPVYSRAEHPDVEVKPFLPGLERVVPRERLEIYNKVGWAYGFSTDNAWIVDRQTGRSFFLAATIYTNEDGVLNDDVYEYATVAWPFLADLAEATARRLWR
jgi:hypothetical protein